ncbi:hypothetical protein N7523_007632 [Penicillium sp. IBT 18751x]|nr:hypothetical protein N7523_007632 [Penicillium sp. IBT 18751x]
MQFSTLWVPVLAALATAESTTVIEYFAATKTVPGMSVSVSSYSSMVGTVLGTNAAGTTYRVGCMSGAPKSDCSIDKPFTMFAGPDTLSYSKTLTAEIGGYTGLIGEDVQCSFTHSTESAVCTFNMDVTVSVDDITTSTMTTTTISYPEKSVFYDKLTVAATATGASVASGTGASSTDAAAGLHNIRATAVPLGAAAAIAVAALF